MSRFISGSRKSAGCKDPTRPSVVLGTSPAHNGLVSLVTLMTINDTGIPAQLTNMRKMSGNDDQSSAQPAASVVVPVTGAVMPLVAMPLQHIRRPAMPFANDDLLTFDPDIPFTVPAEMA